MILIPMITNKCVDALFKLVSSNFCYLHIKSNLAILSFENPPVSPWLSKLSSVRIVPVRVP